MMEKSTLYMAILGAALMFFGWPVVSANLYDLPTWSGWLFILSGVVLVVSPFVRR